MGTKGGNRSEKGSKSDRAVRSPVSQGICHGIGNSDNNDAPQHSTINWVANPDNFLGIIFYKITVFRVAELETAIPGFPPKAKKFKARRRVSNPPIPA